MEQQQLSFLDERRVFTVSEIVNDVRSQLESSFGSVWVQGEISNLRRPPSGHLYFTLKDSGAQISAVCFRLRSHYLKFSPEDGMDVVARGSVSVYPPRGQLQLMVEFMEPLGRGVLQVAFEQLKLKLEKEGLFDLARKRALPLAPRKVGVVTSPTGAALHDILRVLLRRGDRVNILLYPSRVQGEGASAEIAAGIDYLNGRDDIDAVVIARGGGSLEDLWAFNEESVARAIFSSRVPVISAVGHEIDFTISDFVADVRAATPTAAAEIIADRREEVLVRMEELLWQSCQSMRLFLQERQQQLRDLAQNRAFVDAESRVKFLAQRLDELQLRLLGSMPRLLDPISLRKMQLERELIQQTRFYLKSIQQSLLTCVEKLNAFSPQQVLERGYAIVSTTEWQIVRSPEQIGHGDSFHVRVADGEFQARKERDDGV